MTLKYRKLDNRKKIKLCFRLDSNTFSQLKEISNKKELDISNIIRSILQEALNNKKIKEI